MTSGPRAQGQEPGQRWHASPARRRHVEKGGSDPTKPVAASGTAGDSSHRGGVAKSSPGCGGGHAAGDGVMQTGTGREHGDPIPAAAAGPRPSPSRSPLPAHVGIRHGWSGVGGASGTPSRCSFPWGDSGSGVGRRGGRGAGGGPRGTPQPAVGCPHGRRGATRLPPTPPGGILSFLGTAGASGPVAERDHRLPVSPGRYRGNRKLFLPHPDSGGRQPGRRGPTATGTASPPGPGAGGGGECSEGSPGRCGGWTGSSCCGAGTGDRAPEVGGETRAGPERRAGSTGKGPGGTGRRGGGRGPGTDRARSSGKGDGERKGGVPGTVGSCMGDGGAG